MNDDQFLEDEIRKLRPAALPADLRERMADEPALPGPTRFRRVLPILAAAGLAAAACVAIVINLPSQPGSTADTNPRPPDHLSIIEQESTLMDTRSIAFREHDGRMWELVEQEWRDDTVALCSTAPVRVRSSVTRPVTVWVPVEFQ
jgi:hypothetical protein